MTKAMTPMQQEMSQLVGLATALISKHPEAAAPFRWELVTQVLSMDMMLLDFDARCEVYDAEIRCLLAVWATERAWSTYVLVEVAA